MDLNKVMLIGRITVDLEVKKIWESGNSVLNFVLATNRVYKTKDGAKVEEAEFHRCVVFGRLAEIMGEYLGKWRQVYVEWRLKSRQWEDQAGNRRHSTEIVVNEMTFCDNKWGKNNSNAKANNNDENNENEEDVPF